MTAQPAATRPIISVVMANHDGAAFVAEAVRSVLDQTLVALELILVDDGSDDDSVERARAVAAGDPRLVVVALDRNLGPAGTRNRGLDLARGDWIAVVDSDDLLAPTRLEHLLTLAQARGADLVADNLTVFSAEGEIGPLLPGARRGKPREVCLAEFVAANSLYGSGPNLGVLKPLISTAALRRCGVRYDEGLRIGEDYDLVARLLAAGARYWIDPTPLYRYRKHSRSISHRLRRPDIEALLAGDDRFRGAVGDLTRSDLKALNKRRRSLERALAFDSVVAAIKARSLGDVLAHALRAPDALPLLMMPLAARLGRVRTAA
jgi:succinoglycan biosynthesis protein ExoO